MGKDAADVLPALAVVLELMLGAEALEIVPASLQLRDGLPFRDRLGHGLAVHLRQLRLVVESLKMGRTSRHAEVDHSFRFLGKMRLLDDAGPFSRNLRGVGFIEQGRQSHCSDSGAGTIEKGATAEVG